MWLSKIYLKQWLSMPFFFMSFNIELQIVKNNFLNNLIIGQDFLTNEKSILIYKLSKDDFYSEI